jgi:hypothetical protein
MSWPVIHVALAENVRDHLPTTPRDSNPFNASMFLIVKAFASTPRPIPPRSLRRYGTAFQPENRLKQFPGAGVPSGQRKSTVHVARRRGRASRFHRPHTSLISTLIDMKTVHNTAQQ